MRVIQRYSPEFKADAVQLLQRSDRTLAEVADSLGVNRATLYYWYRHDPMTKKNRKKAARVSGDARPSETAEERAARLEKENARLKRLLADAELDKAILREAASGNF